ncbi:MAG: hypothetical protein N2738_08005 [Thermodesulfovibrionales bacterium]|nr:hypothetical protein [Thermodesulfovibrionales bacterium]
MNHRDTEIKDRVQGFKGKNKQNKPQRHGGTEKDSREVRKSTFPLARI